MTTSNNAMILMRGWYDVDIGGDGWVLDRVLLTWVTNWDGDFITWTWDETDDPEVLPADSVIIKRYELL